MGRTLDELNAGVTFPEHVEVINIKRIISKDN
jgi:hypothetical protein